MCKGAVEPSIVTRRAVTYAGVRERLNRNELGGIVPRLLGDVAAFLQQRNISPTGPPIVRYVVVDYNTGTVEIDAGFPVGVSALLPDRRVRIQQIPGGRYATVIHDGSYDTLMNTTAALLEWGKRTHAPWQMTEHDKVTRWGARVERYDVGPPAEPNPSKWRTEVAILLIE